SAGGCAPLSPRWQSGRAICTFPLRRAGRTSTSNSASAAWRPHTNRCTRLARGRRRNRRRQSSGADRMAPDTRDGIWVGDQYYILATASRASGRSAVLKSGDPFAVFDRTGDIAGPGEYGLYHDGTRHLSLLTLA